MVGAIRLRLALFTLPVTIARTGRQVRLRSRPKPCVDWADFIAIFRKAGPLLLRKSSMADLTKSMNVHDIERPGLLRESERTFDMIAIEETRNMLSASEAKLANVQAVNSALQTELAELTNSTSWKVTAFARWLSSVAKGR